jgi:hypothetical protein
MTHANTRLLAQSRVYAPGLHRAVVHALSSVLLWSPCSEWKDNHVALEACGSTD